MKFTWLAGGMRSAFRDARTSGPGVWLDFAFLHQYDVLMIKFDWNAAKVTANLRKHGVSFEEAQSVFYDEFAVQFFD